MLLTINLDKPGIATNTAMSPARDDRRIPGHTRTDNAEDGTFAWVTCNASVTSRTRACFQRARLAHRKSRQELLDLMHSMRQRGLSYSELARRTGYGRRSVTKWLASSAPRDRKRAALKPTSPCILKNFLRNAEGTETATVAISSMMSKIMATRAVAPMARSIITGCSRRRPPGRLAGPRISARWSDRSIPTHTSFR